MRDTASLLTFLRQWWCGWCSAARWDGAEKTQKRAVASKALPVSLQSGSLGEIIASGLLRKHTRHDDAASEERSRPHAHVEALPSVPPAKRKRCRPSDDIHRPRHDRGLDERRDVPRPPSGARLSLRLPRPAWLRCRGQALKHSLTEVYSLCSSCLHPRILMALLTSVHSRHEPLLLLPLLSEQKHGIRG